MAPGVSMQPVQDPGDEGITRADGAEAARLDVSKPSLDPRPPTYGSRKTTGRKCDMAAATPTSHPRLSQPVASLLARSNPKRCRHQCKMEMSGHLLDHGNSVSRHVCRTMNVLTTGERQRAGTLCSPRAQHEGAAFPRRVNGRSSKPGPVGHTYALDDGASALRQASALVYPRP